MKKRSEFQLMARLIGLVRPLAGYMVLAIVMGLIGHLTATFITVFGGYAVADLLGLSTPFTLRFLFGSVVVFALVRGLLRYAEQACNHFIAFKLLALIRDRVFRALRRLCPAKLEGKGKGNLISIITSDVELLEVFYAHTISPIAIAALFSVLLCLFIGGFHPLLGVIALATYLTVGVAIPLITSRRSGDDGLHFRAKSGELSGFVLDSLRGLTEILQYGQGEKRLQDMNAQINALSEDERRMNRTAGRNQAATHTVILLFDLAMLLASALLYQRGLVAFTGVLIPTIALMSSFGPTVALANLGSTLQNTFAAGNRILDILDDTPVVAEKKRMGKHRLFRCGGGKRLLCLRGRTDSGRRVAGDSQGCGDWRGGQERQRKIHPAEAVHALLGRAEGPRYPVRDGRSPDQHCQPPQRGKLRHAGNAPVP